jgi:hypothetical protein
LGAFIGSYNRVIDFWFNAGERDREMIARADFEDDTTGVHFKGDGFNSWANKGSYNHNSTQNSFQDGSVCPCCGNPYSDSGHTNNQNNFPVID